MTQRARRRGSGTAWRHLILCTCLSVVVILAAHGPHAGFASAAGRGGAGRRGKRGTGNGGAPARGKHRHESISEQEAQKYRDELALHEEAEARQAEDAAAARANKAAAKAAGASPKPSNRNLGFIVDALFGVHNMDGGSTLMDFVVVPCGLVVCGLHLVMAYRLWARRATDVELRVKSLTLVAIQSVSGVVWYVGFVVRFGHFARPASGLFAACTFWNYYTAVVFGFGVWSACILFRLLRLYFFFILNKSELAVPGLPPLSFKTDWPKILGLLAAPLALIYGVVLPLLGDNNHKRLGGKYICVYEGKLWATVDTVAFVAVWLLLFYLVHALRNVRDQYDEYQSIRRALTVSASCLGSLVLVDVLQIDGLWVGRSLITTSVLASVTTFFYLQNKGAITRVLIGDTSVDRNIREQVFLAEAGGTDEAILEGGAGSPRTPRGQASPYDSYSYGGVSSGLMRPEVDTPPSALGGGGGGGGGGDMRQRGSRKQQSEFTKAILLD